MATATTSTLDRTRERAQIDHCGRCERRNRRIAQHLQTFRDRTSRRRAGRTPRQVRNGQGQVQPQQLGLGAISGLLSGPVLPCFADPNRDCGIGDFALPIALVLLVLISG